MVRRRSAFLTAARGRLLASADMAALGSMSIVTVSREFISSATLVKLR